MVAKWRNVILSFVVFELSSDIYYFWIIETWNYVLNEKLETLGKYTPSDVKIIFIEYLIFYIFEKNYTRLQILDETTSEILSSFAKIRSSSPINA